MRSVSIIVVGLIVLMATGFTGIEADPDLPFPQEEPKSGCTASDCHKGIEDIRPLASDMMQEILDRGRDAGDPAGCVVCHGGNPKATTKEEAHGGDAYYPDPGSPWINENTCGLCHVELVDTQWQSLMMTEAGKIQGTSWTFGALQGYDHGWANYDVKNPDDPSERRGSDAYRAYMENLKKLEPHAFPDSMKTVPAPPENLADLAEHPEQSAFTYIRAECQRCHLGVRGRERRGDYRGMGCSACHIPYGNEGNYEGNDPSIARGEPRHLLVHTIQATRDTSVTVNNETYTGIPVETCTTCHDRGKRIGVTFQGLMESAYTSPYTEGGGGQLDLHSKHYMVMQEDIHYQQGMICQDCHTSIDVHGDGFLAGSTLGQIQIECADCHGTPDMYPWELPLGYGDEFSGEPAEGSPRGVAKDLPRALKKGKAYPAEDGYILTARGNPFPEVVRRGNKVIVHTVGGKDIELTPLKLAAESEELAKAPRVAMKQIPLHINRMECYACHSSWAPQCYGCHVKIDYSKGNKSFDWVEAGHTHGTQKKAAVNGEKEYDAYMPGHVKEQRSYLRFEDPALGVNGEGRICPVIPGCQPSVTVIGENGETHLLNHIFRSKPGTEGAGEEGQLCIDMSPVNPHTNHKPRSCESCHATEKAQGYGISGGRIIGTWDKPIVIDLTTVDGRVLPKSARNQFEPIEGLVADWSRFVTEDGKQLQTVGHHFSLSRPLDNDERAHVSREGICLSCHQEIPKESLAVSFLHHAAAAIGAIPETTEQHDSLVHKLLLLTAWGQVGGGVVGGIAAVVFFLWYRRRRRPAKSKPV